jgi:hypothetical protein
MAFVLLVLHLGVLVCRKFSHFDRNSSTLLILQAFWMLWMVLPLLVGCTAVAEERKLGTLGGQLCLPVKGRTQLAVKFLTVIGLSVFLGAVMPLLLEGSRILPTVPRSIFADASQNWVAGLPTGQFYLWYVLHLFILKLPVIIFVGMAVLGGLVSFYASSLARNTLQALAPAVLGVMLLAFLSLSASSLQQFGLEFLWQGQLYLVIALPLMLSALIWFSAQNFRQSSADGKLWTRNALKVVLALTISVMMTSLVYHRFWEKFTPFEPWHGPARLSLSDSVQLKERWLGLKVRLPDGKIWEAASIPDQKTGILTDLLANWKRTLVVFAGIEGSNWLTAEHMYRDTVGIKTDGTLWVSEAPKQTGRGELQRHDWLMDARTPSHLVRVGAGTDWKDMLPFGLHTFLVKADGTLWRWGCPTNFNVRDKQWPGLQTFTPERLGVESNWAGAFSVDGNACFLKNDGSLWLWYVPRNKDGVKLIEVGPDLTVSFAGNFNGKKLRSAARISFCKQYKAGVFEDGTFRVWAEEDWEGSHRYDSVWKVADLPLDYGTNWLAVAGSGEKIVTLKADGTLWLWNFHFDYRRALPLAELDHELRSVKPVRLGTHADWIAVSGTSGRVTSLAADGSLWLWPVESVHDWDSMYDNDSFKLEPLLDISRKPQFLGNVFAATP